MVKCCIRGCNSYSRKNDEGLSFFRFPKNEGLKKLWTDHIGTENIKSTGVMRICSKHFEENCVNRTLNLVRLKDDAVPTLFPFTSSSVAPRTTQSIKTENTAYTAPSLKHMPIDIDKINAFYADQLPTTPTNRDVYLIVNTGVSPMVLAAKSEDKIKKLRRQVLEQRKKIKVLTQKCRRLNQKVLTYQNLISEMRK